MKNRKGRETEYGAEDRKKKEKQQEKKLKYNKTQREKTNKRK